MAERPKMNLGLIVDEEGKIKNHRSILKIFVNPILRLLGWNIATNVDEHQQIHGLRFVRCPRRWSGFWLFFDLRDGEKVVRKRIWC